MFYKKWQHYSYTAQKTQRRRMLRMFLWIVVFFLFFSFFTNFVFFTFLINTKSMEPTLQPGDRGLSLSTAFLPKDHDNPLFLYKRGSLVVLRKNFGSAESPWYKSFTASILRFLSAQRWDIEADTRRLYVKRIIALPGDRVTISNYTAQVQPADQNYTLSEFELATHSYTVKIPDVSSEWDSRLPFSGSMDTLVLKDGECFVLSDDRGDINDSRTWGPVPLSSLIGKPLLIYWPMNRFGQF
ncbi:MAG: signal peptidase I [Termitinemataceae bacterium]